MYIRTIVIQIEKEILGFRNLLEEQLENCFSAIREIPYTK